MFKGVEFMFIALELVFIVLELMFIVLEYKKYLGRKNYFLSSRANRIGLVDFEHFFSQKKCDVFFVVQTICCNFAAYSLYKT